MAQRTKEYLKTRFETADFPTEFDFIDLIDSLQLTLTLGEDGSYIILVIDPETGETLITIDTDKLEEILVSKGLPTGLNPDSDIEGIFEDLRIKLDSIVTEHLKDGSVTYDKLAEDARYKLPIAGDDVLGGIKVGTNLLMNPETGVLSATGTIGSIPSGPAGGDLFGEYPNPRVNKLNEGFIRFFTFKPGSYSYTQALAFAKLTSSGSSYQVSGIFLISETNPTDVEFYIGDDKNTIPLDASNSVWEAAIHNIVVKEGYKLSNLNPRFQGFQTASNTILEGSLWVGTSTEYETTIKDNNIFYFVEEVGLYKGDIPIATLGDKTGILTLDFIEKNIPISSSGFFPTEADLLTCLTAYGINYEHFYNIISNSSFRGITLRYTLNTGAAPLSIETILTSTSIMGLTGDFPEIEDMDSGYIIRFDGDIFNSLEIDYYMIIISKKDSNIYKLEVDIGKKILDIKSLDFIKNQQIIISYDGTERKSVDLSIPSESITGSQIAPGTITATQLAPYLSTKMFDLLVGGTFSVLSTGGSMTPMATYTSLSLSANSALAAEYLNLSAIDGALYFDTPSNTFRGEITIPLNKDGLSYCPMISLLKAGHKTYPYITAPISYRCTIGGNLTTNLVIDFSFLDLYKLNRSFPYDAELAFSILCLIRY